MSPDALKIDADSIGLSPESVETLYELAYRLYEGGKYEDSEKAFRFLTSVAAFDKKNWMGLGASLQMQKAYEQAIQAYMIASILDPAEAMVHLHIADCLFAQGKAQEALRALNTAESIAKKHAHAAALIEQIQFLRTCWESSCVSNV